MKRDLLSSSSFRGRNFSKIMLFIVLFFSISNNSISQLTGVKTIPVDYASIAGFVTDLNAQGVGPGGVTLDVPSGYTETAPAGGYIITATGTFTDQIIISGSGVTPVITASPALTVGALNDGIFILQGSDYVTINGLQLQENAANTTTTAASNNMTEWGIALLYLTATDGAQNCTISNNMISLNRLYQNTFGIYSNSTHSLSAVTTSATATGANGGNSGLKIYGNSISNVNLGISVVGPTAATDHNDGIDIGGAALVTGNTLTNYGTTGTFSAFANVSGTVNGILVRNSKNFNISFNSIISSVGGTTAGTLRGIFVPTFSVTPAGTFANTVNNNTFNIQSGNSTGTTEGIRIDGTSATTTSTLAINNNQFNGMSHTVASSGTIVFISQVSPALTVNVNNNTFNSLMSNTTGSVTFIAASYTMPAGGTQTYNNNQVTGGFNKTGAGGTVTFFTTGAFSPAGTTHTSNNNNFSNITVTPTGGIVGWNNNDGGAPTKLISNNTFTNWTSGSLATTGILATISGNGSSVNNNTINSIAGAGTVTGITFGSVASAINAVTSNTVSNLSTTGVSSTLTGITISGSASSIANVSSNTIFGLGSTGTTPVINALATSGTTGTINLFQNKVYGVNAAGVTTNTTINGVLLGGGLTVNAYNNLISGLTAPNANANDAIRAISITSTTANSSFNVYYNSIYLNAVSTGTNFGTTALFHTASATATTAALDIRNNIIINESAANGTGLTVAYRRSSANLGNYAAASNRNLFYAGAPSASNLIFTDGTTPQSTMAGFKAAVSSREANSLTGEAFTYSAPGSFFISLTGSSSDFLRPVAAIVTQVESGASQITSPAITTDYASVIRALEVGYAGTGTNPDLGAYEFEGTTPAPVITLNSVTPAAAAQCTTSSRLVSVTITTASGTVTDATLNYFFNGTPQTPVVMVNTSGNIWEGTMNASVPANANVTWNVVANNSIPLSNQYNGASYVDEPAFGYSVSALADPTVICDGESSSLSATIVNGSPAAAPSYLAPPAVTNPTFDEDLSNITITKGATTILNNTTPINSLVGSIGTATGTAGGYSNFTAFGPYVLNAGDTYNFSISSVQQGGGYSNSLAIYIDYNRNGVFTDLGEAVYISPLTAGDHTKVGTFVVPMGISPGLTRMRLINHEGTISSPTQAVSYGEYEEYTINLIPAPGSITWSDGFATIGTGTPISVAPTTTTNYSATVMLAGCPIVPDGLTTVTVNALPAALTANNSIQCGTSIPSASVTSNTGASSPTFNWYDASVAGNLLQSNTLNTYLSSIATSTSFWVSEVDGATGCESPLTQVNVTVIIPDPISASVVASPVCLNEAITLNASNDNPTPVQNYLYVWSGAAGSGAEMNPMGASITITPTLPGTYTYTLTGIDGICTAITDVDATINPLPTALAVSSSVSTICNGETVDLFGNATSNSSVAMATVYSENFDAGLGGWTTENGGASPALANWLLQNGPYSYTTYFTNFNTPQGGGFMMANGDITGSGVTANTKLVSPVISTVGMTSATLTFENLYYKWTSGDATVRIEISTDGGGAWTLLKDYLPLGNQGVITSGAQVPANESITLTAPYLNQANLKIRFNYVSTWGYYWVIDNFAVTGMQSQPATFDWTSNPAGFTSTDQNPTGVAPAVTTDYIMTATNSFGCTEADLLTVEVLQPTTASMSVTECDSYTLNSNTYTTSGTYVQTLTNAVGCDSTLTLDLVINSASVANLIVESCGSYLMNGATYTSSGNYVQIITNVAGCDSTINLTLSIIPAPGSTITATGCQSYTHNTVTYTTSGTYTQTYTNVSGCDSIVTLNLTINGPATASIVGNGTLIASAGVSYQWLNCATMAPIANATFQTYTPTVNGSYAVVVNYGGGCSDTSACVAVNNLSIVGNELSNLNVYPNPTRDVVTLTMNAAVATVDLVDAQGKLIETMLIENNGQIDFSNYERGVYYLRIRTENETTVKRVVKN